jgi:hypothetical protein
MSVNIKKVMFYMPRKFVTKLRYFYSTKKILNLKNPRDFNEKIIYLMLEEFGKKEQNCADKYLVRNYVEQKGLKDKLNKLYGKYDNATEIQFNSLPSEYVLKTNHGCGCTIIKNKNNNIDIKDAIKKLDDSLKRNYAKETLEYQYDKITPCILCEEYLKEDGKNMPTDYKFFCFNGKAHFLLVCGDRDSNIRKVYYDLNWNKMSCTKEKQIGDFEKPKNFEEMIKIAEKLSEDFKFVRVDLYNINGKIYFGELTFTPRGGINNTIKPEYLNEWGNLIKI